MENLEISKLLLRLFRKKLHSVTLVSVGRDMQLIPDNNRHRMLSPLSAIATPTCLEVCLFLHLLLVSNDSLKHNTLKVARSGTKGKLFVLCVSLVTRE